MSELKVTIDEIKELMDKMEKTGLGKVEVEDGDFKLTLAAKKEQIMISNTCSESVSAVIDGGATTALIQTSVEENKIQGNEVTAPIVGTFYTSPAPDKEAFVKVGDTVKKGDVLFIIESMKLMNEVQSEFDGQVAAICVEDTAPVEFGQTVMIIQ